MNRTRIGVLLGLSLLFSLVVIADPPAGTPTATPAAPAAPQSAFEGVVKVSATPANIDALVVAAVPANQPSGLEEYLVQQFPPVNVTTGTTTRRVFPTSNSLNRTVFMAYAKTLGTETQADMKWTIPTSFAPCTASSDTGICVEVSSMGTDLTAINTNSRFLQAAASVSVTSLTPDYRQVGLLVLRNAGATNVTVSAAQVGFSMSSATSASATFTMTDDVQIKQARSGYCTIAITGLESANYSRPELSGGSTSAPSVTYVENGNHVVTPVISGVSGPGSKMKTVSYTTDHGDAPDNATGAWNAVPVDGPVLLTAQVTLGNGKVLTCAGNFQAMGTPLQVQVGMGGTCQRFYDLRDYFLNLPPRDDQPNVPPDQSRNRLTPRDSGVNEGRGLSFPGLNYQNASQTEAKWATTHAEVPAAGVLALGKRNDSVPFTLGPNGETYVPALGKREHAGMVITLNVMGKRESDPLLPIYYAVITDTSVLPNVLLKPTGIQFPTDEDTMVGFLTYQARTIQSGSSGEQRGSAEKPFWRFMPGDKPVFGMDSACNVNIIGLPVIEGLNLPPTLESQRVCLVSSVMKLRDVRRGLARLILERHVPELANEMYDPRLFMATRQGKCFPVNPHAKAKCVRPSVGPPAVNEQPTDANCSYQELVTTTGTTYDGCGRPVTYTYSQWVTKYRANCFVQKVNKCDAEAAIRFASYEQSRMLGAMYFAIHDGPGNDLDGVPLSPVLGPNNPSSATENGQGIVPHSVSVGGSIPHYYTDYPAHRVSKKPGTAQKTGIGCAPFQVGNDTQGKRVGVTAADIGASVQRKPIFTYSWEEGPAECMPPASVDVAYFGSHDCVGVPNTSKLCGSNNVPASTTCPGGAPQVRPANVEGVADAVTVTCGDNYIARTSALRFCPGSIQSTSIIVSASPLIVDVAGTGISISRSEAEAVAFDIKGEGKKVRIDWPVNTKEVAFLVLPSGGAVTSIKQLFGDYKAKDGFESLSKHDGNKDKFITEKDAVYGKLRLWFDRNRNGTADKGEIETLPANGVTKISLTASRAMGKGIEGKALNTTYFNSKAGVFRNIDDQWFYLYGKEQKNVAKKK